nr:MAG TPA: hypothetical protein [Caudoviricetes sp.]
MYLYIVNVAGFLFLPSSTNTSVLYELSITRLLNKLNGILDNFVFENIE